MPVVGAGMSANAVASDDRKPPGWAKLAKDIELYLDDEHGSTGAIDAISNFEQRYGRLPLIDKLRDLLLIDEVKPSQLNIELGRIPFDAVLTTNFDFVLEDSWRELNWPFEPIVGEQRLAARRRSRATLLVKFHGDVHHPDELVATENDYDGFLTKYPLLATFVANLLITRVPVLIGYSADDPDFRALLALIKNRLGSNSSTPWVILATGTTSQVSRFERRGVRVVVLESRRGVSRTSVFQNFFKQLADALEGSAASRAESTEDSLLAELRVPVPSGTMVVFLGGNEALARYREAIFPALRMNGLIPVTPDDIQSQPSLHLASLSQLLRRAAAVVLDGRNRDQSAALEIGVARSTVDPQRMIVVDPDANAEVGGRRVVSEEADEFDLYGLMTIEDRVFDEILQMVGPRTPALTANSVTSRLKNGDSTMAFLEAVVAIEAQLRSRQGFRQQSFRQLVNEANIPKEYVPTLHEAYKLRGEFLHRGIQPPAAKASEMTLKLLSILGSLPQIDLPER